MGYKYNGSPLLLDQPWTDTEGTQYPASWLRNSSTSQRAGVPSGGITWEADPAWYDQRFYFSPSSPKDIANLKVHWIQEQKDLANGLLTDTDWMVLRAAEGGTAVPSATATYRAAVRTKSKEREDQITACSDTAALSKLITAGEEREKFDTSKEVKDSNGASFDPKQYESFDPKQYEQNPDGLKKWPDLPS